jgi:3-methyladenine DNA glycosylase AlkD
LGGAPETVPVLRALVKTLAALADPERAATHAWFFETGKGQYGEGDRFLGIRVPLLRSTALLYRSLEVANIERLLASPIHEHRFVALVILVARYEEGSAEDRAKIFDFYLAHTVGINNWDLVDTSAPYIVGDYLLQRPRDILARLARSPILWERRIAIVSTLTFVKQGQTEDAFRLAEVLLADGHDLMHKATGWVLRETGKVSRPDLLRFLKTHYESVPRTTLRYAIEHFSPAQRKRLLAGQF